MSGSGSRSDSDFYSGLIDHTPEAPVKRINVRREAIHVPLPTLSAATITQEASGFRLLKIRPNGDSHSPIHGDLTRWRIADAPDFHAISYAPGSGTAVCHVILGEANIEFAVTQHVWKVLRRMRHATAVVYVWVDVLCIDQANRLERISQVANLRQVYSRALTVKIWLGEEKRLTDGASEIDLDEALFASLAKQREPWWKQLWALQNCAYARTCPVVMLGPLKIGLDDFIMRWAAAMESFKSKTSPQEKQFLTHLRMRESLAHIQAPLELWRVQRTGNQPRKPLLYRLRETYWRQCPEPHDMIFALLDFVDEEEANKFLPDYSISFEDLWTQAMDLCRRSPLWQPGIDDYFFDIAVLKAREIVTWRDPSPCGIAIIMEAYEGNLEILPFLREMRTLADFQLARDSREFKKQKNYRGAQFSTEEGHVSNSLQPPAIPKDVLETTSHDHSAGIRLLLINEHLCSPRIEYSCGLFKLSIINCLPRTLAALLKVVKDLPSRYCFSSWLKFLVQSDATKRESRHDTIRLLCISILDTSFQWAPEDEVWLRRPSKYSRWMDSPIESAIRLGKLDVVELMLTNAPHLSIDFIETSRLLKEAVRRGSIPMAELIYNFIITTHTVGFDVEQIERAVDEAFLAKHTDMTLWLYEQIKTFDTGNKLVFGAAINVPAQFLARAIKSREGKVVEPMIQECIRAHVKASTDASDTPGEVAVLQSKLSKLVRTGGTWKEVSALICSKADELKALKWHKASAVVCSQVNNLKAYEFYWTAIQDAVKAQQWTNAEILLPEAWTTFEETNQPIAPLYAPPDDIEDHNRFWEKTQFRKHQRQSGFVAASGTVELEMGLSPRISAQIHEYLADISARRSPSTSSEESTLLYRPTLPNEIRVFELSPGVGSDPLQGRLRHIDIGFKGNMNQAPLDQTNKRGYTTHIPINFSVETSERVPYTALSYYWGDAGPAHEVLVEGHPVKITSTVDQMLRHLRQVHRPITLWLDQLCIDQESNADKSIQVRLMGSIYSKAENTIIWLGEKSDQGAFLGLQVLSQSLFAAKDFLLDEDLERLQRESFGEGVTFDMVEELFERPWVRRTWVVQEAVLSRDPYFMAGQEIVAWGDFAGYCVSLKEMDLFRRYDGNGQIGAISGAEILADMFSMRQTLETSKTDGLHFLSWLTNTRHASVTNPLDKIYGLLGVCPIAIHPDYTKSKEILYHETLTMLIRKDFKQDPRDAHRLIRSLLSCVDHETDARVVPSWVADWSKPRRTFALAPNLSIHPFFRAGTRVRWDEIALSADGRVITTSARFLGVVCQVSASLHPAELHYEDPQGRNSSLQTCVDFINTVLMTSAHDLQFENFCATIVAGKVASIVSPAPYPPEFIEIISLLCDATTGRSPSMPNQIYTKRQKSGHFTASNLARRQPGRTFQHLRRAYRNAVQGRRLCWIQTGHLGLVPQHTMVGDLVAVLPGCSVPFVFRKEGPDRYSLVGECYVHDVMDGKFMETATGPLEEIAIV